MAKPIINIAEVEFGPFPAPMPESAKTKFGGAVLGRIGPKIGARKLGYNITVLPAGRRAFPFHSHRVNEEMFFILEGEGEVRIGDKTFPIRKGDFIAHPPGGPQTAHQIVNTSNNELRYLAVSTMELPEIADYPDSNKFGVMGPDGFRFLSRLDQSLSYWDGE
jgi:uncharacterized cupin superfamily protein